MLSYEKIKESADFIVNKIKIVPHMGIILGSGLDKAMDGLTDSVEMDYSEIPNFPVSTVEGHQGKLVFGKLRDRYILVMKGRFHFYEGYSMAECGFPIAVMKLVGVEKLIITNAVGGINADYDVGELMLIKDHIKMQADSPLRGVNINELGPRFPDMTHTYTPKLRELTKEIAYGIGVNVREGVYGYMTGPSFETPAEIRALDILGADVVGMSTVPEAIVANYCGMKVLGISCVCNKAAGITGETISHEEVLAAGERASADFSRLVVGIIEVI